MYLESLELDNFRNYNHMEVKFNSKINVFIGYNAQGKTNLLESIYFLSSIRSRRIQKEQDLINWEKDFANIKGSLNSSKGIKIPIEIIINKLGKKVKLNHIEQNKLSDYIGKMNVVLFTPEDLVIVKGSPSIRRKFMNMEFGQINSKYLYYITKYRKVLKQRNHYIKRIQIKGTKDVIFLTTLSDQLAILGAQIVYLRIKLLKKLEVFSNKIHYQISQGTEELKFKYISSLNIYKNGSVEMLVGALKDLYQQNQSKEIYQGKTLFGPHLDDIKFLVNDKNVSKFGSQGQQRTTALSLKLAEIDLIYEEKKDYPILLLDDVLSELDDKRQTYLLKSIQEKVQTFITTTDLNGISDYLVDKPDVFNITSGTLVKI